MKPPNRLRLVNLLLLSVVLMRFVNAADLQLNGDFGAFTTSTSAPAILALTGNNLAGGPDIVSLSLTSDLTLLALENFVTAKASYSIGELDDGLRVILGGVTLLDFDQDDWEAAPAMQEAFGALWTPWSAEGAPFELEISPGNINLYVTAKEGVNVGQRVDILTLFTPLTQNAPTLADFNLGDFNLTLENANHGGPGELRDITATIEIEIAMIPEPHSGSLLLLAGLATLVRRRRG